PVFLRMRTDLTWNDVLEAAKTKKPVSVIQKVVPTTKLSKQHSILFSVIPSRDVKSGKKIVTSDDEDEETQVPSSSLTNKNKKDTRELCQYGEKCYRTNPDHLKQYQHPTVKSKSKLTKSKTKLPCTFGSKCNRQSSVHLANFSHPSKSESHDPIDIAAQEELLDPDDLVEIEEPASPTTTDNLLVKDKNKDRQFDANDNDDDDQPSTINKKTTKRKRNLEEKPTVKSTRKRIKKS
ncbi:unnamed protein product, partial [Adineta steineri]